jgi:hypothetical protein
VRKSRRERLGVEGTDDESRPEGEVTAQPCERCHTDDDERLVPLSNVGGAAHTPSGSDSGGDPPGADEELSNLAEAEPPAESPEVGAVHVRRGEGPKGVS